MKTYAFLAALFLCGCMQQKTVAIDTSVSEAELAPYREAGTASITGQGFLRQNGGGVVTCAGSQVILAPDLPPIRQAIDAARAGSQVQFGGQQWGDAGRKTICDAQGNFSFEQLPAANWYVLTEVRWEVGYSSQGGTLGAPVTTRPGEQSHLVLSDDDFLAR